eukprot:g3751.t1
MILRLCLLLVFALAFARGAIEEHRILTLPGYGKPKTKMYSGYIDTPHPTNISTTVHSHYWFVTCSECMDSASAPTLIWMQGGPGGSSLIGLFTENGPLTLNDFSVETDAFNQSGVPTVFDNPYSWHTLANVVYFEHPAPTGFSYCSGYGNDSYYLYDTCDPDLLAIDPATNRPRDLAEEEYTVAHLVARRDERTRKRVLESPYPSTGDDRWYRNSGTYACGQERASTVWLNLDAVREAIHVQTRNESGRAFSFSTTLPSYGFSAHSLLQLYNETLVTSGLRILQYSGDADPCVPYIGTARWIESLNLPVAKPWRPWKAMSEYSGYVVRYETTNTNGGDKDGRWIATRKSGAELESKRFAAEIARRAASAIKEASVPAATLTIEPDPASASNDIDDATTAKAKSALSHTGI